jgi:omega-6 fatty acid desaturase (delta-12 desaturase)
LQGTPNYRESGFYFHLSGNLTSSFLKFPAFIQWFTGNIGYHHVHNLSSRITNSNLARCHNENDLFKEVKPISLFSTFKALTLSLGDEAAHRMISFRRFAVSM